MRRLAIKVINAYCATCHRFMWPWQSRCGFSHTGCKHVRDGALAEQNGVARWTCAWCGR